VDRAEDQEREEEEREHRENVSEATHEGNASCDSLILESTKPTRQVTARACEGSSGR
jgi:hypothetical protein